MWYVYFLQLHSGDVYVGSTSDLRRRFESPCGLRVAGHPEPHFGRRSVARSYEVA
ncbi:GIY-YIG nuclease family protein [Mesorhizobium sp. VK9D]|uniref:GIY-YIG nuclease family protein n=1 Tax=Mesorhizobium australafricanum TaxID=3072311 RepID=UPI002A239B48|nr:GIY-YIG nuclease family protein [Mesorhizobium sp. VK9D]MDX8451857.1 GIY-YIG nuclease family protein [Mesorhizobium sp. VK9D]